MDRLLLDTTYLLPIFGVRVGLERFETMFPLLLDKYSVVYNPISIVEAKWIVLRLSRRRSQKRKLILERFREGLKVLLNDERFSQTIITNSDVEEIADRLLLEAGVRDYFDRLIYSTAAYFSAILLTEDETLKGINLEDLPCPSKVIKWSELAEFTG
jgi:hypothetical protein